MSVTDNLTLNERKALDELTTLYTPGAYHSLRSLEAIALAMGISRERIRKHEVAALAKLRKRLTPDWRDVLVELDGNAPDFDPASASLRTAG